MALTTWTSISDVVTSWTTVTSPHRASGIGGWGDAWGFFPWGQHELYEDFTKIMPGNLTTWTKL